jgi:hypothetical protein
MSISHNLQDLWDEYQRVFRIYWDARCELVERAIEEAETTDLYTASCEAHLAYREARRDTVEKHNRRTYAEGKK